MSTPDTRIPRVRRRAPDGRISGHGLQFGPLVSPYFGRLVNETFPETNLHDKKWTTDYYTPGFNPRDLQSGVSYGTRPPTLEEAAKEREDLKPGAVTKAEKSLELNVKDPSQVVVKTTKGKKHYYRDKNFVPGNGKAPRDVGGNFSTTSSRWTKPGVEVKFLRPRGSAGSPEYHYSGIWTPFTPWVAGLLPAPSSSYLDSLGTTGIAESLPTNPLSGMAQFVAELRDIPKMPILSFYKAIRDNGRKSIKDMVRPSAKAGGSEYLNLEFGWRPLLKDMGDFHKVHANADKHITQFVSNSGKCVRRRRIVLDEVVNEDLGPYPLNSIGWGPSSNILTATDKPTGQRTTSTRAWTSCSFTYYVQTGDSFVDRAKRSEQIMSHLYGTRLLSLDTLYNLTPWSWAVDWVSNLGDVMRNLSAFQQDGLVMNYGYIMYHQREWTTYRLSALHRGNGLMYHTSSSLFREQKWRRKATPYGFGLSAQSFSPRQLAIIAALGLSRL